MAKWLVVVGVLGLFASGALLVHLSRGKSPRRPERLWLLGLAALAPAWLVGFIGLLGPPLEKRLWILSSGAALLGVIVGKMVRTKLGEVRYYATLSKQFDQLEILGVLSAIIMAAAAIFGGMNTMFTAVAGRIREIGTLKALGFSRRTVLASFLFESVVIALAGGVIGALLGMASHGVATSAPTVAFTFTVTGRIVAEGLGLSLLIGFVGGWWPAHSAARLPVIEAVRHI